MAEVTERQKKFEDGCREIADDLYRQVDGLPLSASLRAKANVQDLFNCIRTAYDNGRADENERG